MASYFERLTALTAERGALCVGIDPQPSVLSAWGLSDDVHGLEACARGMVRAAISPRPAGSAMACSGAR